MNWNDIVQGQQYQNSNDWDKEALRNSFINQQIDSYGMNDQQAQAFRAEFDQHTAPRGNVYSGVVGDTLRSVGSGALSATADALSFPTGGKPNAASSFVRNYAEDMAEERSPSTIQAVGNLGFGEGQEITGRGLAYGTLSGLGSVAPMIGGGGIAGGIIKGVSKLLPAYRTANAVMKGAETVGAATAAAPRLAKINKTINSAASTGGYGLVGGAMVGGGAGHQTYEEILRQPDQVFLDSPAFQGYYRQTYQESPNDKRKAFEAAKEQLAAEYSKTARNIGGVIGAVSVAALGPQLHKIITGKGAQGALMGGLQGAGTEAAQEIFESGGQQLGTNYAMAPLDNRSLWQDVANVAGTNALIGAGAGGSIGSVTGHLNRNRPELTEKNYEDMIKGADQQLADLDVQLNQNTQDLRFGTMQANTPDVDQVANTAKMKEYEADRIKILAEIRKTAEDQAVNRQELTKKQNTGKGKAGSTPGAAEGATGPEWQQWTPPEGIDFDKKPGTYNDPSKWRTSTQENPFNEMGEQRVGNENEAPFEKTIDALNYAQDHSLTKFPVYIQKVEGGYIIVGLPDSRAHELNQRGDIIHVKPGTDFEMPLEGQYIPISSVIDYHMRRRASQPKLEEKPPEQPPQQPPESPQPPQGEEQPKPQGRIGRAANLLFETAQDAYNYVRQNNIYGNVTQLKNGFWSIQPQTGSRSEDKESVMYGGRSGNVGTNRQEVSEEQQRRQHPGYPTETPVTPTTPTQPTALEDRRATFVDTRGNVSTDLQAVNQASQQQQTAETTQARQQRETAAALRHPGHPYTGEGSDLELYAGKAAQLNRAMRKFTGDTTNREAYNEFKQLIREVKQLEKKALEQAKARNKPVEITDLVDMVKEAREAINQNKMEEFNRLSEEIRQKLYDNEQQLKGLTQDTKGLDSRLGSKEYQDYLRMTADEVSGDILSEQAREKQSKSKRWEIQPDDTILDGIRKLGGITKESLEDTIYESMKASKGRGIGAYVNKNGYSVDDMGRILSQYGFMDENGQELGANSLSQAIDDELQGRPRFSSTEGDYDRNAGEQRPRAVDGGSKITKPAVDAALAGEPLNPIYKKEVNRILNEADEDPNFNKPEHLTQTAAEIEQGRKNQAVTEDWYDRYEQVDYIEADNRSALDSDDFTSPDWDTIESEAKQSEMLADAALNEELNRTEEDEGESNPYTQAGQTLRPGARTSEAESAEGGKTEKKPAAGERQLPKPIRKSYERIEKLVGAEHNVTDETAIQSLNEAERLQKNADKELAKGTINKRQHGQASAVVGTLTIQAKNLGYEVDQSIKIGDQYDDRRSMEIINYVDDTTGTMGEDELQIHRIHRPQVNKDGKIIQRAQVDFVQGYGPGELPTKKPEAGETGVTPALELTTQTEGELQQQEKELKAKQEADKKAEAAARQKAEADKEQGDFKLTGSDSVSDKAAAEGQGDLLSGGPTTTPEKPEKKAEATKPKKGPGQRYSIKKETGEKNLFVSHNITAKGVLEANKLGGLAAPSIAVARSDISSFDNYGEISLLAKPELLTDRKIRAFDSDIYSPRQPRTHYDINAKAFYGFNKTLDPDNIGLDKPNIDESSNTDGPRHFMESDSVKLAYLQEQGKVPALKNSKVDSEIKAAAKSGMPASFMDIDPESKFYEQAEKYFKRKVDEVKEKAPERGNRWNDLYFDENGKLHDTTLRDFYYQVKNFSDSNGKDINQFRKDIDKKIRSPKHKKPYDNWTTDKFNSMVKGKKIFKGYTNSGDRRYQKYTLENVVKDMTQKLQNGENLFYGSGSIRSAYAKEFKSIKDIQKSRNKIITKAEFDTLKEESQNVLMDALERLKPYYNFDSESFGYLDDAGSAIAEGRAGQAEAFVLNAEAKKIIDDLTEYLTALPTTYFEAKAQRAVSFSEFDTAVVPKGTDKAVLDILRGAGLKIKTYDKKVEGDRQRVIAAQNRLLFKQGATEAAGIDSKTASKVAENMERELGVKVNIAKDESQLPQHIQDTMQAEGTTGVRGVFDQRTGQAWIVSKNLDNEADAIKTVLHEVAGHQALSQMLGTTMDNIMGSIYKNMPASEKSRIENSKEYAGQLNDLEPAIKQAIVAEEYLADLAATNPTSSTLRRFISKVRRVLRKLFPSITWTENDVVELLQAAREKLKVTGGQGTQGTQNRYSLKAASVLDSMPEQLVKDMKKVNAGIQQQLGIVERVKGWFEDMELTSKDTWKAIRDYAYTKTIDSFYPIAKMEKSINQGNLLEASESASKAAARTKNLNSQMTAVLGKGTPMLKDGSVVLRPGSKGMLEIFEPVAKDGQLETWEHWSAAMRSQRLINEDKAANIQGAKDAAAAQQAIDQLRKIPSTQYPGGLIGLNAAIKEQKVKKAIANKMIRQKRENLLNQEMINRINQYVDARPALKKQFEAVHKDYQKFNKEVLDFAEESGLIDPESRKLWEKDDYLPFHRMNRLDEGKVTNLFGKRKGLSNQKSGIMQLTGGVEQISPIESIYRNTASLIDASMKNIAMLRIADIGTQTGLFELTKSIEKITDEQAIARLEEKGIIEEGEALTPTQLSRWKNLLLKFEDYGEGTAKVSRDGKTEVYQVHDTELLKTVQALGPDSLHAILRIFAMPGRLLRAMVTTTPSFMARNFIRDTLSTWMGIHPKINGQSISASIVKAVANVKNGLESDDHWALMMAGGGSGGYYEVSHDNFRGTLTPNQYKAHHRKVIDNTKKAWDWWQKQGSRFEDANRLAIFEEVIAKGGSIAEAAHQAQDVLNFTRTGSSQVLRIMTATIPFLNARMQGLDRLVRGGIENPAIVFTKGAIYTAASLALWAAFKDDDRYKSLPEHEKLTWHHAWTPGGEHLRFPKPFEHGAIFATVPEIAGNMLLSEEDGQWAGKMIGGILQDIFALDYPQFMGPALEVARNKNSFTGAPIIPLGQQYQLPQSQYSPWTSETAKVIAESMPNIAPDWTKSPKKVEHLLKGYFGSFGTWLVGSTYSPIEATTRAVRGAPSRPAGSITDIPVLGSFARGTEQGATRYSTEMYDLLKSSNELATTIKRYQEEGRTAEAGSLEKANKKSLENRKMLNRYSKEISEIRKGTRKTLESKFISSPIKKQKSNQDNRKIQRIYRKAIKEAS